MKSGIYKITNIINNKNYIGSSVNINKRKNTHFSNLKRNIHPNIHLQRAYNKYGENNFKFEIIEYCNKNELLKREQYYLDLLHPKYNILKIAGSPTGTKRSKKHIEILRQTNIGNKYALGSKHNKEVRERNRIRSLGNTHALGYKHTDEAKRKISKARLGHTVSLETRQKISIGNKGKTISDKMKQKLREKVVSEETKEKIRIKNQIPIIQLSKDKVFINQFDSLTIASDTLKINRGNISNCCRQKRETAGGYRWMYKEQYDKLNLN